MFNPLAKLKEHRVEVFVEFTRLHSANGVIGVNIRGSTIGGVRAQLVAPAAAWIDGSAQKDALEWVDMIRSGIVDACDDAKSYAEQVVDGTA